MSESLCLSGNLFEFAQYLCMVGEGMGERKESGYKSSLLQDELITSAAT